MKSAEKSSAAPKKRPPKAGTPVLSRWQDQELARVDEWRREQPDMPTRPEALRRLAALSLDAAEAAKKGKKR